jgi:hypothetical protein
MLERARITVDQIIAAIDADGCVGFCVRCGAENCGVEPDACEYPCEACGQRKVYGAEDLLIRLAC